jgi:hypothetical protein
MLQVAQQLRSSDAGSRQAAIAQLYAAASVTAAGASAAMPASTPQPAVSRSVFGRVAPRSVLPSSTVKAAPVPAVAAAPAAAAAATSVKPVKSVASKSVKKPIATASVNKPPKAAAKAAAPTGSSRAYSDLVDTVPFFSHLLVHFVSIHLMSMCLVGAGRGRHAGRNGGI